MNTTVDTIKHSFRHQNLTEYNDDVYSERTFDALDYEFSFELRPSAATLFWRFGPVFSQTEDFFFDPNSGRYNNTDLLFIEVDVGGRSNNQWEHPNNIALSSYYIKHPPPPYDQSTDYRPGVLDADRIYLTGLSMGGYGTWYFAKSTRSNSQPLHRLPVAIRLKKYGNSDICRSGIFMGLKMMRYPLPIHN